MPIMAIPGGVSQLDLKAVQPIELSFPLPRAPRTNIHLQLTIRAASIIIFLTTAVDGNNSTTSLGSFVYALPDRLNPGQAISTPLYMHETSLEFTTRLAKLIARKSGRPVYVGNSVSFTSAGSGGTPEEEIEGFKKVVNVIMGQLNKEILTD